MRRTKAAVLLGLLLAANSKSTSAFSITEACTLTVNNFAWYLDHAGSDGDQRAQDFAALFTPEATFIWPDDAPELITYTGRTEIAESYLKSTANARQLYLTSNIRIVPETGTTASGTSYLSFFMHATGGSMQDEGAVAGVLEVRDTYETSADACLISSRKARMRLLNLDGVIQLPDPD
jgi:hypothetical protein